MAEKLSLHEPWGCSLCRQSDSVLFFTEQGVSYCSACHPLALQEAQERWARDSAMEEMAKGYRRPAFGSWPEPDPHRRWEEFKVIRDARRYRRDDVSADGSTSEWIVDAPVSPAPVSVRKRPGPKKGPRVDKARAKEIVAAAAKLHKDGYPRKVIMANLQCDARTIQRWAAHYELPDPFPKR